MKHVLLTGMARSGTTLLDKYLGNHPSGAVASQPLSLFFIELKKAFYASIGHPEDYYVLSHLFGETRYAPANLSAFLQGFRCPEELLMRVFANASNYDGQYRKYPDPMALASELQGCAPARTLELLLAVIFPEAQKFRGLKEIYIEEFIPYFLAEGWSCAVVVRDPRDVLASMNKGRGSAYTGSVKPTLFNIRNWRKSVRFHQLPGVYGLQFEALVQHAEEELSDLVHELSGREAQNHWIPEILKDEYGNAWKANSSFNTGAAQKPSDLRKLSPEQASFIEAYCYDGMVQLGYMPEFIATRPGSIDDLPLNDPFEVNDERLSALYSNAEEEREREWAELVRRR
jgi:hypothetical protein